MILFAVIANNAWEVKVIGHESYRISSPGRVKLKSRRAPPRRPRPIFQVEQNNQANAQKETAVKRNDAEKKAEKIMAVVLNGLKSLYTRTLQQRPRRKREIYNFVTSTTNYRGRKKRRRVSSLQLAPFFRSLSFGSGQINWRLIRTFYTFWTRFVSDHWPITAAERNRRLKCR
jgi:hypothetical protein